MFFLWLLFGAAPQIILAQGTDSTAVSAHDSTAHKPGEIFTRGQFSGKFRNYFMATLNQGQFQDYYANAWGGTLSFRTAEFKGFQAGIEGIFVFNLFSNDLSAYDSIGGGSSRYERQLFDLASPNNRYDLDQLQELWIRYRLGKTWLRVGKQSFYTPLVNPQDGRMKPYLMSGLWSESLALKKWRFNAGWLWGASPRSFLRWYNLNNSIGLANNGFQPDGSPADYQGKTQSRGLGVAGARFQPHPWLHFQAWNYYLEGLMNSAMIQVDYEKEHLVGGIQYLRQDPLENQQQIPPAERYTVPGQTGNLFSLRAGYRAKQWRSSLNYTRILATGRFLFPREFGREQWFTTLSRGRFEGMGDVHAFAWRSEYQPDFCPRLLLQLDLARVYVPGDAVDFTLNKYGTVSYDQLNLDARYHFPQAFEGLNFRFLYVYKRNHKAYPNRPDLRFNRSHLHHLNLVAEVDF